MRQKLMMAVLSGILLVNSLAVPNPLYAANSSGVAMTVGLENPVTENVVYLEDGEGTEGAGKGTKEAPYQNIRTALEHIQDGQVLKLIGMVKYTNYEKHTDGSAKPLFIDKQITVEGDDEGSGLMVRSTIQLGADVIFKNMNLEMIPEIILGRMLGQEAERSTTIFAAGHSFTLDHVNTNLSSSYQTDVRPYISGGAYKGLGNVGEKAVIRIMNPTDEMKLSGIYAGDYWDDREMDVEIHLDGKLQDTVLYTGGVNGALYGNVEVYLYKKSNLSGFDRWNHEGNVNVRLAEAVYSDTINFDNINELTLENKAKIIVPLGAHFNVEKVTLMNQSMIDFRYMKTEPNITGDFIGTENVDHAKDAGAVLLNNDQTLNIGGSVSGLTRLNSDEIISISRFLDGHVYVRAGKKSDGHFTIEGTIFTEFEMIKGTEQEQDIWMVCKKEVDYLDQFNHFVWQGGTENIVNPQHGDEFAYPILFYNNNNSEYKPGMFDLFEEFEYDLVRTDGAEMDLDWDVFIDWDFEQEDDNAPVQLKLIVYNPDKAYGELLLTVTHIESGKEIQKVIQILSTEEVPSPTPAVTPTVEPTVTPTVIPTVTPTVKPTVKPTVIPTVTPMVIPTVKPTVTPNTKPATIKLNRNNVILYRTGSTVFQLKATVVGTSNLVKYTSSNNKIVKVDRNGKVTANGVGTATITAQANGVKTFCTVIVKNTSLKLNINKATLYTARETSIRIKPTVVGANRKVTYSTSNNKIAKVDKNGKVTAVKAGRAVITVKANGLYQKCQIIVKKHELKVSKTTLSVKRGKKIKLSATATPKGTITFTSSDKRVATINKQGIITGVKAGTTTIYVRCHGITKKVVVKVRK